MFCYKCGRQLPDDALFCQFCGTKQLQINSINAASTAVQTDHKGELNRDALKIYLGNILALEYLTKRYANAINALQNRIDGVNNYYLKTYKVNACGHCVHFLYKDEVYLAWRTHVGPYCHSTLGQSGYHWVSLESENNLSVLKEDDTWRHFCNSSAGFFTRWQQCLGARDVFFEAYEDFKRHAPAVYRNKLDINNKNITIWNQQLDGMTREQEDIRQLLTQAYDLNIIPAQFRHNIHTIYYLHEFVSTSQESFSTALLHFDLDKIKEKLDTIIWQQETMIIQNAVSIAQNEKLFRQNQQQLERLSRIESNTYQSAQYAKIAANNSETCKWLAEAKYIENSR